VLTVGDVGLGTVDDVLIAVADGGGLNASRVRTRIRLGQAEGSQLRTGGDIGEVLGLLLVRSE